MNRRFQCAINRGSTVYLTSCFYDMEVTILVRFHCTCNDIYFCDRACRGRTQSSMLLMPSCSTPFRSYIIVPKTSSSLHGPSVATRRRGPRRPTPTSNTWLVPRGINVILLSFLKLLPALIVWLILPPCKVPHYTSACWVICIDDICELATKIQ